MIRICAPDHAWNEKSPIDCHPADIWVDFGSI